MIWAIFMGIGAILIMLAFALPTIIRDLSHRPKQP